jgi:cholesterol transport system auxiliary component
MNRRAFLVAVPGSLAAAGCQSLIPGAGRDPPRLYEPTPKSTFAPDLPVVGAQLIIETPQAAAGLQSARIAVKEKATTLDYYARSDWTDVSPRLVQTMLLKSFENSGKILAVGREGSGLRSDYILKTEIRHFQAELYEGPIPNVNVEFNVKLVKMPEREIVATAAYARKWKSASANLDDVIEAFDEALGGVLRRVVEWTIREIDKLERRAGRPRPAPATPARVPPANAPPVNVPPGGRPPARPQ